jgi:hypothetical protein
MYFTTSFHTYIARSEVSVCLPLFTPVSTGVRQRSFAVGVQFGSHVSISDACGGMLICVPWEVFPMCYPSLAHVGKSFGTLSYVLYVYFVLDFG